MKYRRIAVALIMLSMIAGTFVATAAATVFKPNMLQPVRQGKYFTFIIDTSYANNGAINPDDLIEIYSFAEEIDRDSISLTVYDLKGEATTIPIDWTQISISSDSNSLEIYVVKQDGVPVHGSKVVAFGSFSLDGPYAGDTFQATGPAWGWANIH